MEQFTRHETVVLTRTSPGRLAYLARTGIVVPAYIQQGQALRSFYSWEQILELRAIQNLRRQVSLQTIRKILDFLECASRDRRLYDKHLVVADDGVEWVVSTPEVPPHVIQVADRGNRNVGQLKLLMTSPKADVIQDVWNAARRSQVIDFESFRRRALESPSE